MNWGNDYLLGELEAMVDEQMVVPAIEEVVEPVAEAEEEHVIASAVDMEEGQMDIPMIVMEEDLTVLFGEDDDFEDDDSEGFDEEEAWEVSDAEVPPSVTIGELGPRIYDVEGQVQRDTHIQQLQTTVIEMGSRESTLMRCILGLERRIAALEKRSPGPQ
nr:hypothetical protein [Tanacetum cinerariifolium]